jgi:hypothetical protein
MMAKIAWKPKQSEESPFAVSIPDTLKSVGFMVKDSQRFADSGGWGWAEFKYDPASDTFTPQTTADEPPQENDAKCGFACIRSWRQKTTFSRRTGRDNGELVAPPAVHRAVHDASD